MGRYNAIMSSRGCPGRCTFCCKQALSGYNYHTRSAENILGEIMFLMKEYSINHFNFRDDVFTVNKAMVEELCDLILDKQLDVNWVCTTRVDLVNRELLQKMKDAGCKSIDYGIESGCPPTLKRIKKGFTAEKAKEVVKMTKGIGLNCYVNFMFGFPWEDAKDIRVSTEYIKEMMPMVTTIQPAGILVPYPGTEIYEEYKDEYNLGKWWLRDFGARLNVSSRRIKPPLFAEIFFDSSVHGQGFFFKYSKGVVREIMYGGDLISKHNMKRASKRITALPILNGLVFHALIMVCKLSRTLYKVSPTMERIVMKPFYNASQNYRG